MAEFMEFLKKLGIGLIMLVGGALLVTFSSAFNTDMHAGKFLNTLTILGVVLGLLMSFGGVLYIKFYSPFRRK